MNIYYVIGFLIFVLMLVALKRSSSWKIKKMDAKDDCDEIIKLLCCKEFPLEWYYGINIAFYRTFCSPSISRVYYNTGIIEKTTEERVVDTDIIMWQPMENGLDSEEGKRAMNHLNKIHGVFSNKTQNRDFVYVLCCFMKDTIRMTEITGYRYMTAHEKEALFNFWIRYGTAMNIQNLPKTLEEALKLVDDYVEDDQLSKITEGGKLLTSQITALLCRWFWGIPDVLVTQVVIALLYIVGGPTFVYKLGLPKPYEALVYFIYIAGYLFGLLSNLVPRHNYYHSSEFYKIYKTGGRVGKGGDRDGKRGGGCPIKNMFIEEVGPEIVLSAIAQKERTKQKE